MAEVQKEGMSFQFTFCRGRRAHPGMPKEAEVQELGSQNDIEDVNLWFYV